jgi:hypothetical protein
MFAIGCSTPVYDFLLASGEHTSLQLRRGLLPKPVANANGVFSKLELSVRQIRFRVQI